MKTHNMGTTLRNFLEKAKIVLTIMLSLCALLLFIKTAKIGDRNCQIDK